MNAAELDRTRVPEADRIRPFEFPQVRRARLPNGLNLLSARHGRVPIVTVAAVIDAGGERDPAGAAGLAHLVVNGLEAGTRELDADAVASRLERLGVELHTHIGWDAAYVRMTVHRERLEPALELFASLLREPAFPEDEVRRLKEEQLADILQRKKEPRALASDMALRFIYAAEDPYARPLIGVRDTVAALDREQARAFHERHYAPAAAALILVGAIEDGDRERIERHFGEWGGTSAPRAEQPAQQALEATTVFIVDRPGAVQSEIRIGQVGVERGHPDYFPLLVMNTLLGGAFTSRLNMSLRERHGFTYGARSAFAFRRRPGPFMVQAAVATDVTAAAVREAVREIETLRREGARPDEVAGAREYLAGVMPLELQTTDQLASRLADLFVFRLPDRYFEDYPERILAVETAEVDRVAREHLTPGRHAIVVVGDAAAIRAPLDALGWGDVQVHAAE